MLNPQIVRQEGPYQTEEGCLSLDGVRPTTRYRRITLTWTDLEMREHTQAFTGFPSTSTVHAPQAPSPHPSLTDVRRRSSLRKSISFLSRSTVCSSPFTIMV
jgi:hypothetical protein